ncbi:MAG: TolB protein [Acidobacteriota bacterium]|jgi:dipeptidyl aminopeptidase/acylaminoacyl peptidase
MNNPPKLPHLLIFSLAAVLIVCGIASLGYERVAAQSANGKIAFTNEFSIYTMNADGSGQIQLTPFANGIFDQSPAWSPDGARIACGRATFTVKSQIYVMNADGSNATRLTNNSARDRQPSWSPDGARITFVSDRDGNDEIYVMNADGTNQTRLTNNTASEFDPAWSPDGAKIAFTSTRAFAVPTGNDSLEIYVMNADGSNAVRLTNNSAADAQPAWSLDGTRIAFSSQRDGLPLIYIMNADGSNPINATQSTTLDSSDPEWSPDGTTIAFTSYNRVGQTNSDEIFLMNVDGSNVRRITNTTLDEHELAWQPLASAPSPTPTPSPSPSPLPTPTWTISGVVKDSTGNGLADVTMILQNDFADTQITFTDQNGNYLFHYSGGNGLFVTPSKPGFVFNPQSIGFVSSRSVSGDQTASFTGTPSMTPSGTPILLGWETPERAIALDSVTTIGEPFNVNNTHNFSADQRTRISLFAVNIELGAGETLSIIQAQAEDSLGQIFPVTVEYFGAVPNFPWLKQVVLKLPDEIGNKVEVRISLRVRGIASNKVIVKVLP